jgi:NurA-like 5'-3' nuclease
MKEYEEIVRNGVVITNFKFSGQKLSTKRGINLLHMTLSYAILMHYDPVVISYTILKFNEDICRNSQIKTYVKIFQTDRQRFICLNFCPKKRQKDGKQKYDAHNVTLSEKFLTTQFRHVVYHFIKPPIKTR